MRHPIRARATLLATILVSLPALAQEPGKGQAWLETRFELQANGDGLEASRLDLSPDDYAAVKTLFPDPATLFRELASDRDDREFKDIACRYEDEGSVIRLETTTLGAVQSEGEGDWAMPVERRYQFLERAEQAGRAAFRFQAPEQLEGEILFRGRTEVLAPAGATNARWDDSRRQIRYHLAYAGPRGKGKLDLDFKVKDRLMASVYKVYGLGTEFTAQWVAKTVVRNTGDGALQDFRIRYRVEGYSEWSPWNKCPELIPGQTAVTVYYPILDRSIATIRSNTPANVMAEWRYTGSDGREREDSDGKRIVLLGVNEFVFSNFTAGAGDGSWHEMTNNAPLLAAWVTRNDPVVKQFAAMANKNAAGLGASTDDLSALAVLKALYELMQINDFTYQHPPSLQDRSVSFDVQMVQNVKFPRDVIRDKSGTCIDLAILFAAMANAIGLKPYLALIPGHCFPLIRLPSGTIIGVETTGVLGGLRFGAAPFDKVVLAGVQELKDAQADGRIQIVDVQDLWTSGVSNPELEELPPDILQKWQISEQPSGAAAPLPAAATPPPSRQQPAVQPEAAPAEAGEELEDPYVGTWSGMVTETLPDGATVSYRVDLDIQVANEDDYTVTYRAQTQVPSEDGPTAVHLEGVFFGNTDDSGGTLLLRSTRKTVYYPATGETVEMPPDTAALALVGAELIGRAGNDQDGWVQLRLTQP